MLGIYEIVNASLLSLALSPWRYSKLKWNPLDSTSFANRVNVPGVMKHEEFPEAIFAGPCHCALDIYRRRFRPTRELVLRVAPTYVGPPNILVFR